jgi:hypothetical protein
MPFLYQGSSSFPIRSALFAVDVFCACGPCRAQNPREPSPSSRPSRIGFQDPSIYPTSAVVVVVVVEAGKVPQQVGAQPSSSIDVLPSFPSSSLLILMNGLYSTMPLFWVLGFDSRLGCSSPSWTRWTWRTAQSFHHRDRQGRVCFSSVALAVGVPSCIAQQSNRW